MPATDTEGASLREQRSFLLRSLSDLDAEHEAGDIDDDDYRALTDDYTARAAAVLRAIQELDRRGGQGSAGGRLAGGGASSPESAAQAGAAGSPESAAQAGSAGPPEDGAKAGSAGAPGVAHKAGLAAEAGDAAKPGAAKPGARRRRRRALLVAIGIVGFGAVAAWAIAQSSGRRLAGQTITGNAQLTTTSVSGGVDPRLATAADDVGKGQVADALKLYDAVLKDDPAQPVALGDGGWLEAQAGLSANRPDLVDAGLAQIVHAEKVDASFPDPHFFRGVLLLQAQHDAPGAVTEFRTYLGLVDPASPQVSVVEGWLQRAIAAAGPNVPPGPNAPVTTTVPAAP